MGRVALAENRVLWAKGIFPSVLPFTLLVFPFPKGQLFMSKKRGHSEAFTASDIVQNGVCFYCNVCSHCDGRFQKPKGSVGRVVVMLWGINMAVMG